MRKHSKQKKIKEPSKNQLDIQWRTQVLLRDHNTCQVCGKINPRYHAHHIIPREYKPLRHDIDNGITLCLRHHKWCKCSAHLNALWFSNWLKKNRPIIYEKLNLIAMEMNSN